MRSFIGKEKAELLLFALLLILKNKKGRLIRKEDTITKEKRIPPKKP
jgi:hypothetical protein